MKVASGLAALALWLAACAAPKPVSQVPANDLRGVLLPTDQLAPPFVVQQRIAGKYQGEDATIECVVQLNEGKLTVLGLTPFGTRAFVIEQKGLDVQFQKFVDRDLPVQPEVVLYDIHRVFFRGLPRQEGNGTREAQDQGELVRETWENGHIVERRFQSLEGPVANLVVVSFDGAPAPVIAPHVKITNVAYAYSLEIDNTDQKLLDDNYTLTVESDGAPPAPSTPPAPEAPAAGP